MTRRKAPSSRRGWRTIDMDLATAGAFLRKAGVAAEGDPVSARASFDDAGRPRRIHARYADGWRATVHAGLTGDVLVSQTLTLRVKAKL